MKARSLYTKLVPGGLALLLFLASTRESVPVIRYILQPSHYVDYCQNILHHKDHHAGQCLLTKELNDLCKGTDPSGSIRMQPIPVFDWLINTVVLGPHLDYPVKMRYFDFSELLSSTILSSTIPPP